MVLCFVLRRRWKQRAFLKTLRDSRISAAELQEMVDSATASGLHPPFIVDLRHPLDFLPDPRVIPGAVRIMPSDLEKQCELLPRDRDVILYCTCPSEETSAALARRLQKLGVSRVRPLQGGFDGWRDAGLPLVAYASELAAIPTPQLLRAAIV